MHRQVAYFSGFEDRHLEFSSSVYVLRDLMCSELAEPLNLVRLNAALIVPLRQQITVGSDRY